MPEDAPILVTAPTGNVGREVVRALLDAGARVRAGVRDPERARAALPPEVEAVRLDFADPATFAPAVAGARGLFLLRPIDVARVGPTLNALVDAAAAAGVEHCVFLSVAGAERQRWLPHRKVELHLQRSAMSWTFLRPNHFAQNFTGPYREDLREGCLVLPAGDGRVSFVDCADLGDVAALALLDPAAHRNVAYHLTGPETLGFADVAALLSERLGRPVRYEPVSVRRYLRHLRRRGHRGPYLAILTLLHVGVRRGNADAVDPELGRVLGRPPRDMAAFVAAHAAELA